MDTKLCPQAILRFSLHKIFTGDEESYEETIEGSHVIVETEFYLHFTFSKAFKLCLDSNMWI